MAGENEQLPNSAGAAAASPATQSPSPADTPPASSAALPAPGATNSDAAAAGPPPAAASEAAAVQPPSPAAAAEPAKAEAPKAELTVEKPSLLESAGKDAAKPEAAKAEAKPETKAAEPAKPDAVKVEAKPEAKPGEAEKPAAAEFAPVDYKWELPANIKADTPYLGEFNATLNEAKLPAELGQEVGKKLLGIYDRATQEFATQFREKQLADQHQAFNDMRGDWNKRVFGDEVLGGSGHVTAMKAVARARDALVSPRFNKPEVQIGVNADGTPRMISKFEEFLRVTGAGDHPVFLDMLHNAAPFLDEPQADRLPINIKPAPTNGKAPGNPLYDNPRSQQRS